MMFKINVTWRRIEVRWSRAVYSKDWWRGLYEEGECLVCRRRIYRKRKDNTSENDLWIMNKYPPRIWLHADMTEPLVVKQNPFLGHPETERRWFHQFIPRRFWRFEPW